MKRETLVTVCAFISGALLLVGCAATPESSVVKQKGTGSLGNYEEGETLAAADASDGGGISASSASGESAGGSGTGISSASGDGAGGSGTGASSASGDGTGGESTSSTNGSGDAGTYGTDLTGGTAQNALRAALDAPEYYQSEISDKTGSLQILTDAVVEIPDASRVSSISVSQRTFAQDGMDRITEAFFPDAVFYSSTSYYQKTKAEYLEEIEALKGYVAEGNLDPYDYGTDEYGNYNYDIYSNIEFREQMYESAPESRELEEVQPQFEWFEADDHSIVNDGFRGVAVVSDGTEYDYELESFTSMPMMVSIKKIDSRDRTLVRNWLNGAALSVSEVLTEEEIREAAGITLKEAQALADEKVALLGLDNMELNSWEYGVCYTGDYGFSRESWADTGYILHYTRKLNGIPVTYTIEYGGNLEEMDSVMEPWCYEVLDITVTKDGIDTVFFCDEYEIGDVKTENLNLLSFDEIMEIYEKMMLIQNADVLNYEVSRTYHIDRITFGYSRIYEPASDSRTGVLVPVWDFFGSFQTQMEYGGEQYDHVSSACQSYLTVNAVDGSIIDRGLGY